MITRAQARELERLHKAVIESVRDVWRDVPDDPEMLRRMEAIGRAQFAFTSYLATLTEQQP